MSAPAADHSNQGPPGRRSHPPRSQQQQQQQQQESPLPANVDAATAAFQALAISAAAAAAPAGGWAPPTIVNVAKHNAADMELRMFGCTDCDKLWYQKVPKQKIVSRCRGKCGKKYTAIPWDKEPTGLGFFRCRNCSRKWTSMPAARDVFQECYKCHHEIYPYHLIPSQLLRDQDTPREPRVSGYKHSCWKCKGVGTCPLRNRGFTASQEHDSTGSTTSLGSNKYTHLLTSEKIERYRGLMHAHNDIDLASNDLDDDTASIASFSPSSSGASGGGGRRRGGGGGGGASNHSPIRPRSQATQSQ